MSSITFDTLKFANRLKAAGVPHAQAEAEAEALSDALEAQARALQSTIETALKHDLSGVESRADKMLAGLESKVDKGFASIDVRFAEMSGKFALQGWMLGIVIAGIAALILKTFF